MRRLAAVGWLSAWLTVVVGSGCTSDVELGADFLRAGSGGSTTGGSAAAGGGSGGTAGIGGGSAGGGTGGVIDPECVEVDCGGAIYSCGNCIDDDGDGAIDAADSECLGRCDADEDSYFVRTPGQNSGSCRLDCYFDQGAGAGDDDCFWSYACDEKSPSGIPQCEYDPEARIPGTMATCAELRESQSETCTSTCEPLTPNGCDCFGCCELPAGSGEYVFIGSMIDGRGSCSEEQLGIDTACKPCTPVPSCFNACDECELCAGRQQPGPLCEDPTGAQCPDGNQECGLLGQARCPSGYYCITGCCVDEPT